MKAIIPCAGYATRLYPLTLNQPKALLEVQGQPILHYIIKKIGELGCVDTIYIVTNEKYFSHFVQWDEGYSSQVPLVVLNDGTTSNDDRLGQIGDIFYAIKQGSIDDDVLVIAGDNLFNFSLLPSFTHFKKNNAIVNVLYDTKDKEAIKQLSQVKVGKGGKIVFFEEKPKNPITTTASIGIYYVPQHLVGMFHEYIDSGNDADKMGYFMEWAVKKEHVHGFPHEEKWFDIGRMEALEEARKEFLK